MSTTTRNGTAEKAATQKQATAHRAHPAKTAHNVVRAHATQVDLPLVGEVQLPSGQALAYFAALAGLVALEIIEWPVAVMVGVGHVLAQQHGNSLLKEFGEGLMDA